MRLVNESSKLKDNISKKIDLNKKIVKLDEEKKKQTEKPVNVKKEIVKDIITKKKGRGFHDIH